MLTVPAPSTDLQARGAAYSALTEKLNALGASKLHKPELTALRETADALMFGDEDAAERLGDALVLLATLVESERFIAETSRHIAELLQQIA